MASDMSGRGQLSRVIAGLEKQGATTRALKSGGWMIRFPNGTSTVLHTTNSERRGFLNFKAAIKRGGLEYPLQKGFK